MLLCISVVAYAQDESKNNLWAGISGGYSHNHLYTSVSYRPFTAYESKGGFAVGLPVVYHVADWFSLQTELSILQKNYTRLRTDYYVFGFMPYQNFRNTYLQVPLMARFSFGGKDLRGFCALGGFTGYWVGSRIEGIALDLNAKPYEYNKKHIFDSRRDNRLEYGFLVGFGLEYKYTNSCSFTLEGRYYYSTSDLQKDYMLKQNPRYNNTFVIQAGVQFDLTHLRSFIRK
jgi:opacity protein-like surface antigen